MPTALATIVGGDSGADAGGAGGAAGVMEAEAGWSQPQPYQGPHPPANLAC